ncbi:MAG: DUF4185 domain-containing protein [Chthonomonadales bacterium]
MSPKNLLAGCIVAILAAALLGWPARATANPGVERVENGGLLFTDNNAGVSGTDCGYSIALGPSTLWLFGDVFLLSPDPARRYVGGVSNCGLLVPSGSGESVLKRYRFLTDAGTGLARQLIPNIPGETARTRLWPLDGWYDGVHRVVYVFYSIVNTTGPGPFDFRVEGHGLARADVKDPAHLTFVRLPGLGGSLVWWSSPGILLGHAVVQDPADRGMVYVFGDGGSGGQHSGRLARVPANRIEDPRAYEYYAGGTEKPRWSPSPSDAAQVEGLKEFPGELTVSYNRYLGGYLAVQSLGLEERLRLSLAAHPWGPYHQIAEIGAPHQAFAKSFCYAGKEHPELAEGGGRIIYVTYVDSGRYWLQLLKVTLKR